MYKLVVSGSCFVGKSALTIRFFDNRFVSVYNPTFEDTYHSLKVVDEESCQVVIRDTTSTEVFYPLRDQSLYWGEGFLLVYAVNDLESFKEVKVLRDQVRRIKNSNHVPMVLANKVDKTNILVNPTMGKEVAKKFRVPFVEISAMTGQGVEQAFHELIREICRMRDEEENKKKQGCCFKYCTIM